MEQKYKAMRKEPSNGKMQVERKHRAIRKELYLVKIHGHWRQFYPLCCCFDFGSELCFVRRRVWGS